MLVQAIELKGYKRFPLLGQDTVRFDFNSKLTLITGVNGAGKSSLLSELIPSTTPKEFFEPNGYKKLYITHNNNTYIIEQVNTKDHKYNFYLNGENLNLSQNVTMQKDLIEKHFNISLIVADILIGRENFTTLGTIQRKKLFNSITNMNIDAVIDYYEYLKQEHKLKTHYVKVQQKTLEHERLKQSDQESYLNALQAKETINSYLDILLDLRSSLQPFKSDLDPLSCINNLTELLNKSKTLYSKYYTYITSYPNNNLEQLKSLYTQTKIQVSTKIDTLYSYLQNILVSKKELESIQGVEYEDIVSKINTNKKQIQSTLSKLKYFNSSSITIETSIIQEYVNSLVNSIDIFRQLPPDPDITYTKNNYDELLTIRDNKHNLYIQTRTKIQELTRELNDNKQNTEVVCPNCSHTFIPNDKSSHIKSHLVELQTTLATLSQELKSIEEQRVKYSDYMSNYEQILRLYKSSKDYLQVFWTTINEGNILRKDPLQVVSMIKDLSSEVDYLQQIKLLHQQNTKLESDIDTLNRNKDKSAKDIDAQINKIEQELIVLNQQKKEVLKELQQIDLVTKVYSANNTIQANINKAIDTIRQSNLSTAAYNLITLVEDEIRNYRLQVVKLDEQILSYKTGQEVITKIQQDIDNEVKHITALEFLLSELSPKDGLIAKSISSFLNVIVSSINSIIKSIWNYSMELIPIDVDKDNLDYKFKLQVNSVSNADDISKASSGMREIIDLSFRLTLYRLLNLQGYPVYLDEFGVRLDTSHRAKIADMIFKLMNSQVYSQVFLITHMDLQYAQYKDVEVIEL